MIAIKIGSVSKTSARLLSLLGFLNLVR